jgi:hypothetical protein
MAGTYCMLGNSFQVHSSSQHLHMTPIIIKISLFSNAQFPLVISILHLWLLLWWFLLVRPSPFLPLIARRFLNIKTNKSLQLGISNQIPPKNVEPTKGTPRSTTSIRPGYAPGSIRGQTREHLSFVEKLQWNGRVLIARWRFALSEQSME